MTLPKGSDPFSLKILLFLSGHLYFYFERSHFYNVRAFLWFQHAIFTIIIDTACKDPLEMLYTEAIEEIDIKKFRSEDHLIAQHRYTSRLNSLWVSNSRGSYINNRI